MKEAKTTIQTGFIAQEVDAAAESISYDFDGVVETQNEKDNYSVRLSEIKRKN